jgi:hypothetical protein
VCGLFLFVAITVLMQSLVFKDPLHVTLGNGSTANYYDPSKHTEDAHATEVARAFATADARAAERAAGR